MQETQVWWLVQEDPTSYGATKPMCHNYWACALEPGICNYSAHPPRVCAPQEENSQQWEAQILQWRVAPAHRNWRRAQKQWRPSTANKYIKLYIYVYVYNSFRIVSNIPLQKQIYSEEPLCQICLSMLGYFFLFLPFRSYVHLINYWVYFLPPFSFSLHIFLSHLC